MSSNQIDPPVNVDEFLPMPGAEDILTSPETTKTTVFSKHKPLDTNFLEEEDPKKEEKKTTDEEENPKIDVAAANEVIDTIIEEEPDTKTPRAKIDKSGLVETFSKLIDEGMIIPFEDEKPLEEYSMKDWKELLQANFEERENKVKQEVPASFFESLPKELQYAAKYVMDGGQDIKGLFRALSHVEEVRQLDPANDNDQELIARQYLQATNFGTADEIEEEITTWKDLGTLSKKAAQFKPKLDKMQQEVVEYQLQQQEAYKQQQQEAAQQFMDNVYNTLKDGNLNGVKMDKKIQAFLFTELTQPKYQSLQGRNTNLLGHLLERYQFVEPRYDLIAEALWLLADPESYKKSIQTVAKNEQVAETVRKLKTEEGRRIATTTTEEEEQRPARRTIPRQKNIFQR
jgi:hypothetical protein